MAQDIGSIISGGAAAASTLANIVDGATGGSTHKQRKMMRYQHEMNKKALEEITKPYYEYQLKESPSLQVAGLKKAGINPLSVFGSNAGVPSADNLSAMSAPDAASAMSAVQQGRQTDLAASLGIAEVMKTLAETNKAKAETIGQNEENKRIHTFNQFAEHLYKSEAQSAEGLVTLQTLDMKLKIADEKRIYAAVNNLEADTKNKSQEFKNLCQSFNNLVSQNKLTEAQTNEVIANASLAIARAAREKFGLSLDKEQLQLFKAQTSLALKEGNILYPTQCLVDFLQNNPNAAREYGKAQFWTTFSEGSDGEIHTTIKRGGIPRAYEKRVRSAVGKFKQGDIVDGIIESASITQDAMNWLTESVGGAIGGLIK